MNWLACSMRLPLRHMKDYVPASDGTPRFGSIGEGNLSFPAIVAAVEKSGCQWFVVEQATCPGATRCASE